MQEGKKRCAQAQQLKTNLETPRTRHFHFTFSYISYTFNSHSAFLASRWQDLYCHTDVTFTRGFPAVTSRLQRACHHPCELDQMLLFCLLLNRETKELNKLGRVWKRKTRGYWAGDSWVVQQGNLRHENLEVSEALLQLQVTWAKGITKLSSGENPKVRKRKVWKHATQNRSPF